MYQELLATLSLQGDWDGQITWVGSIVGTVASLLLSIRNSVNWMPKQSKNWGNNLLVCLVKQFAWLCSQYTHWSLWILMIRWLNCMVFTKNQLARAITCPLQGSLCTSSIYLLFGLVYIQDIGQEMHWKSPNNRINASIFNAVTILTKHMLSICLRIVLIGGLQMPLPIRKWSNMDWAQLSIITSLWIMSWLGGGGKEYNDDYKLEINNSRCRWTRQVKNENYIFFGDNWSKEGKR